MIFLKKFSLLFIVVIISKTSYGNDLFFPAIAHLESQLTSIEDMFRAFSSGIKDVQLTSEGTIYQTNEYLFYDNTAKPLNLKNMIGELKSEIKTLKSKLTPDELANYSKFYEDYERQSLVDFEKRVNDLGEKNPLNPRLHNERLVRAQAVNSVYAHIHKIPLDQVDKFPIKVPGKAVHGAALPAKPVMKFPKLKGMGGALGLAATAAIFWLTDIGEASASTRLLNDNEVSPYHRKDEIINF